MVGENTGGTLIIFFFFIKTQESGLKGGSLFLLMGVCEKNNANHINAKILQVFLE